MYLTEKKQFLLHFFNHLLHFIFLISSSKKMYNIYFHKFLVSACASENFNNLRNKQQNIKKDFSLWISNIIVVIWGLWASSLTSQFLFQHFLIIFLQHWLSKKGHNFLLFSQAMLKAIFIFQEFQFFSSETERNKKKIEEEMKWKTREEKNYWSWVIAKLQFHV